MNSGLLFVNCVVLSKFFDFVVLVRFLVLSRDIVILGNWKISVLGYYLKV